MRKRTGDEMSGYISGYDPEDRIDSMIMWESAQPWITPGLGSMEFIYIRSLTAYQTRD